MKLSAWERALARSALYEYLSAAFLYPEEPVAALLRTNHRVVIELLHALQVSGGAVPLADFGHALDGLTLADLQEAYVQALGHTGTHDCPPYEGYYGQGHVFLLSQTLADLSGFYQAFGMSVADTATERLDHISVELEFMHVLALKESHALRQRHGRQRVAVCRDAQRGFLQGHVGQWACTFAARLSEQGVGYPYTVLGGVVRGFLQEELGAFGLEAGRRTIDIADPNADQSEPDCESCPLALPMASGGEPR